ncbi:hypothetical protein [endosymbiont GvMRE of Glomus versiforme]|uniref:hypothetical protein n=1 Tax=endosymbiont GvMRE of Glomus versiforme TaxID=2039283 RepID=UPI000EBEC57D|nr:hypothetical protein [endosymbiont GvMRE of Glomus versiforme]RHZ36644.1 hypothetical protein GvMRE_I2g540 [endosymbiont GvMRE of Glomus versiforme]
MTKYNLEEFKEWVEKNNLDAYYSYKAECAHEVVGFHKEIESVVSKINPDEYEKHVLKWMQEVDQAERERERERERESTTIKSKHHYASKL